MLTVVDVLKRTIEHFARAGIESPKVDAQWILAHGLQCSPLNLFLQFEKPLDDRVLERLRPLVRRRAGREPLQYILGDMPFHDVVLKVRPGALIPRPETEELVENLVVESRLRMPKTILDLGTGSGAIALALAKALSGADITAVDVSEQAMQLARENARHCNLSDRVDFRRNCWFEGLEGKFDWIVSNPPYLSEREWEEAADEVKRFEPRQALVSGPEGIDDLLVILESAPAHLNENGLLACETGITHHPALSALAKTTGYSRWESRKDLSGRPRFFLAWI